MNKQWYNGTCAVVAFLAGAGAFSGKAFANDPKGKDFFDRIACYRWSNFPDERLKIDVKKHSPLSTFAAERAFGEPRQWAFSVHGKDVGVCGGDTMAAAVGTVVTAEPTPFFGKGAAPLPGTTFGSHLGIEINSVRGVGTAATCAPVHLDCTSEEISPTPAIWRCNTRNDFGVFQGDVTLARVDEATDPRCGIFEDGTILTAEQIKQQSQNTNQKAGSGLDKK
jgi:hypothetical protein